MMEVNVAERLFRLGRLELWWIAFNKWEDFCPAGRKHLRGAWYWNAS